MGAAAVVHEVAFRKAEDVVKGWGVGQYMHHTQLQRELVDSGGVEFLVTFSKPLPKTPMPPQVANVLMTIEPDISQPGNALSITYAVEGEQQRRAESEPLRLAWLDAVVHRKQLVQAQVYADTYVPGLPFCTYGLRVPASCVLCCTYRRRRAACHGGTTVRTPYTYQPRSCRTYRVPWHPRRRWACSVRRASCQSRAPSCQVSTLPRGRPLARRSLWEALPAMCAWPSPHRRTET